MKKMWEKGLVFLVSLTLAIGLVPAAAFAEVGDAVSSSGESAGVDKAQPESAAGESQTAVQIGNDQAESSEAEVVAPAALEAAAPATANNDEAVVADSSVNESGNTSSEPAQITAPVKAGTRGAGSVEEGAAEDGGASSVSADELELDYADLFYVDGVDEWCGVFTAPESGTYNFLSSGEYDMYGTLYDETLENELASNDEDGNASNFLISTYLSAGQTVYLKAREYNYNQAHFKILVTMRTIYDMGESVDLQLDKSEYPYTGDEIEFEVVLTNNQTDEVLYGGVDYELEIMDAYGNEVGYPVEIGDYQISAHAVDGSNYIGSTGTTWFSIVEPPVVVDPIEMTLGDYYGASVESGSYWLGKFVAPEDGTYTFYTEGDYDTYGYLYDSEELEYIIVSEDYGAAGGNFAITYNMYEGQSVYLKAEGYGSSDATFTVSVKQGRWGDPDIIPMTVDEEYAVSLNSYDSGNYYWLGSFTAPESGNYTFMSNGAQTGVNCSLYYDLNQEEIAYSNRYGTGYDCILTYYLDEDQTVFVRTQQENSEAAEYSILVVARSLYVLGESVDVYLEQNDYPYTGSAVDVNMELVNYSTGTTLVEGEDYELVFFDADSNELNCVPSEVGTYLVEARALEDSDYLGGTGRYTISISEWEAVDAIPMTLDEVTDASIAEGGFWAGSFTAPESGVYEFRSYGDNDTYGHLYSDQWMSHEIASDDDGGVDNNFKIVYRLEKDQTVYLKARGFSDQALECRVAVNSVDESLIADLNNAVLNLYTYNYVATGSPVAISAEVLDYSGARLIEGEDFEYVFWSQEGVELQSVPSTEGTYAVSARAKNGSKYTNETETRQFKIYDENDISGENWSKEEGQSEFEYTGSAPDLSDFRIVSYTGEEPIVLKPGVDYRLAGYAYSDDIENPFDDPPVNPGVYCAIYEGIGSYKGTYYRSFRIIGDPKNLDFGRLLLYDDFCSYTSDPVEVYGYVNDSDQNWINSDAYYFVYYDAEGNVLDPAPSGSGEYYVAAHAVEGSGYYGETSKVKFTILGFNDLRNNFYHADLKKNTYIETESGVVLSPVDIYCYYGDRVDLVEGTDYKFGWFEDDYGTKLSKAPSKSGNYSVVFEGRGSYTGYIRAWFSIRDQYDLSGAELRLDSWRYPLVDGTADVGVTVTDANGEKLKEGEDYELRYKAWDSETYEWKTISGKPTAEGEYMVQAVKASGSSYWGETGNYSFTVFDPYNMSSASISLRGVAYYVNEGPQNRIPVFLYEGGPVEPTYTVFTEYDGQLDESYYTPSFSGNDRVSPDNQYATLTIEGKKPYHGEYVQQFKLVDKLDMTEFIKYRGCQLTVGSDVQRYTYYSSAVPTFIYDGWPIKPSVKIMQSAPYEYIPEEGIDFTVSYKDANGTVVAEPTAIGKYIAVIAATSNGKLKGSYEVPFAISKTRALAGTPSLQDFGGTLISSAGGPSGSSITIADVIEGPIDLVWSIFENGKTLTEGVDYEVSKDPIQLLQEGFNGFVYTFTGIGNYTGEVRSSVYFAATPQASFNNRPVGSFGTTAGSVGYGSQVQDAVYAYIDSNGVIADQDIRVRGLTEGVDYTFEGFVDAKGNKLTSAKAGDSVFARLVGMGAYAGCERLISTVAVNGASGVDLSGPDVFFSLNNCVTTRGTDGGATLEMLRSTIPNVSLTVYGRDTLVLTEGNGFSVETKQVGNDVMNITVNATEGAPIYGSLTKSVKLVDSFDIAKYVQQVVVFDFTRENRYYEIGSSKPVTLPYANFSYMPSYGLSGYSQGMVSRSVLKDGNGNVVNEIKGVGSYTLEIQGAGDWSGSIKVPLQVVQSEEAIDLSQCTMRVVGDTSVSDETGKAEPTIELRLNNYVLQKGKDYSLEYGNNTNKGNRAWVTATAAPNSSFRGTHSINFTVAGEASKTLSNIDYELYLRNTADNTISPARILRVYKLEEGATTGPEVIVRERGENGIGAELPKSCYKVEYGNIDKPGYAFVKVTGQNGYTGSLSANFYVIIAQATGWVQKDGKWYYYYENGTMAKNKWMVDDKGWRYLDKDGAAASNKWVRDSKGWCYLGGDCYMVANGWAYDSAGKCYMDSTGHAITSKWYKVDGKWYYFDSASHAEKNTWKKDSKGWLYLGEDGAAVTDDWAYDKSGKCYMNSEGYALTSTWKKIDRKWYYFDDASHAITKQWKKDSRGWLYMDEDGAAVSNKWVKDSKGWCYLGDDCYMVANGWAYDSAGKCYMDSTGHAVTSKWLKVDGKWYYFDSASHAVKNTWKKDSKGWVYLGEDCAMVTNDWAYDKSGKCYMDSEGYAITSRWYKVDGKWYYFDDASHAVKNQWKKDSKGWVYLGEDCAMVTNAWTKDSAGKCYMGDDGYAITSKWKLIDGKWYYFDSASHMLANKWQKDSHGWVYLGEDGAMVTNAWTKDSKGKCYMGADGYAITSDWAEIDGNKYYFDAASHMVTGEQVIDGETYVFDENGVLIG